MRSGWMGLPEAYETHLLSRIAQEEAQRSALTTEVNALRAEIERAVSAATVAPVPLTRHAACDLSVGGPSQRDHEVRPGD